jgi:hypothetical protein
MLKRKTVHGEPSSGNLEGKRNSQMGHQAVRKKSKADDPKERRG